MTADKAAIVILSGLSARFIGLRRIFDKVLFASQ